MRTQFGGGVDKATLQVRMSNGDVFDINCDYIRSFDINTEPREIDSFGGYRQFTCDGSESTITLRGSMKCVHTGGLLGAAKSAPKPAPKLKKPSVKASAARVHKAATAQAKLLKRISIAEATLRVAKMQKEQLDVEIKTAQEQLVAAAQ